MSSLIVGGAGDRSGGAVTMTRQAGCGPPMLYAAAGSSRVSDANPPKESAQISPLSRGFKSRISRTRVATPAVDTGIFPRQRNGRG
jgi:hypothetical protein